MEFRSLYEDCPYIPDDQTIPQFFLDQHQPTRPVRPHGVPWLIDDTTGRSVGLEELRARTFGLANILKTRYRIGEDDVVCIFSPNHLDWPVCLWATHRLGGIVSGANPTYTADELAYQLNLTKAAVLITCPTNLKTALEAAQAASLPVERVVLMDNLKDRPSPTGHAIPTVGDLISMGIHMKQAFAERKLKPGEGKTKLALLSLSSGTTGRPKAVAIPHAALIANVSQMTSFYRCNEDYAPWDRRRFRPGDVCTGVLPLYHIYGLVVNLHWILYVGMSVVITAKFNFSQFLENIVRYKITHLMLVPPQVVLLCKHPATKKYDLSHVRWAMVGAAPLSAELTEQFVKVLPNAAIGQGYGMTETCTTVSMFPLGQHIGTLGSAGHLLPNVRAKVVKENGQLAAYGELGELWMNGPQAALAYYKNEEATKETFVDGWVRTGDEVIIQKNGDMFVVDRLKEFLKVRGYQVAPAELEGHLLGHPQVADVCVVGVADEYSGELPLAFIMLNEDVKTKVSQDTSGKFAGEVKASIRKHVADAKVKYKWLEGGVEFVDVIPKNPSGKLLRRVLREKAKEMRKGQGSELKLKARL